MGRLGVSMMRTRSRRSGFIAVAAGSVGLVALLSASRALGSDPLPPVALTGSVVGAGGLHPSDLLITVEPDPAWLDAVPQGASFHESVVPGALVTTDGDSYAVHLDAAALPTQDITADGVVTLEVAAGGSDDSSFGQVVASVRAVVLPDGSYAWTDPQAGAWLDGSSSLTRGQRRTLAAAGQVGRPPTRMVADSVEPVRAAAIRPWGRGSLTRARMADLRALVPRGAAASGEAGAFVDPGPDAVADPVLDPAGCGPNGAGRVAGSTRTVQTTVGTSYPVGNDSAAMTFDDSSNHASTWKLSTGVGYYDMHGTYSQGGTKTNERDFGFEWAFRGYNRAYQVSQDYQKFTEWYDRCPGNPLGPYFQTFEPRGFPGGVGEVKDIPTVDYRKCLEDGSVGTWIEQETTSRAWGSLTGVDISGWIGIDLSSSRGYSDQAQLRYDMTTDHHWLCGQNDWPAYAGKVQDRLHDGS